MEKKYKTTKKAIMRSMDRIIFRERSFPEVFIALDPALNKSLIIIKPRENKIAKRHIFNAI